MQFLTNLEKHIYAIHHQLRRHRVSDAIRDFSLQYNTGKRQQQRPNSHRRSEQEADKSHEKTAKDKRDCRIFFRVGALKEVITYFWIVQYTS